MNVQTPSATQRDVSIFYPSVPAGRKDTDVITRKPPASETPSDYIGVLLVSPIEEDHAAVAAIFRGSKWRLHKAHDLESALPLLADETISIVICERYLKGATWKSLLAAAAECEHAPVIVVASRIADHELWSEALSLGAYDVLAKPFDAGELSRVVSLGWLHWKRSQLRTAPAALTVASGQ